MRIIRLLFVGGFFISSLVTPVQAITVNISFDEDIARAQLAYQKARSAVNKFYNCVLGKENCTPQEIRKARAVVAIAIGALIIALGSLVVYWKRKKAVPVQNISLPKIETVDNDQINGPINDPNISLPKIETVDNDQINGPINDPISESIDTLLGFANINLSEREFNILVTSFLEIAKKTFEEKTLNSTNNRFGIPLIIAMALALLKIVNTFYFISANNPNKFPKDSVSSFHKDLAEDVKAFLINNKNLNLNFILDKNSVKNDRILNHLNFMRVPKERYLTFYDILLNAYWSFLDIFLPILKEFGAKGYKELGDKDKVKLLRDAKKREHRYLKLLPNELFGEIEKYL